MSVRPQGYTQCILVSNTECKLNFVCLQLYRAPLMTKDFTTFPSQLLTFVIYFLDTQCKGAFRNTKGHTGSILHVQGKEGCIWRTL